jgi:recombination protein RecA
MPPKKKAVKDEAPLSINEQLDEKLSATKAGDQSLIDLFQYADEFSDMELECISTGFPSMDLALHPKLLGMPRGRDVEISTADGNIGKTSLAVQIAAHWQSLGYMTGIAEPEKTNTASYLNQLGLITDPKIANDKYAVRIMRPSWDFSSDEKILYSAEQFLNAIGAASQVLDLIIVDSVDALVQKADLDKDNDDNKQVGGISKLLSEYFRPQTAKKATVVWINQQRTKVGAFSPSGATVMVTPGGKAIPFYSSIRIKGSRVQALKEGDNDPYGFITEWTIYKNKCAPQDRTFKLPYIHGEGFSKAYDTFNLALKMKIIEKSGAWYQYPVGDVKKKPELKDVQGFLRAQGARNFYQAMRDNPATFGAIQQLIDGEDVEVSAVVEQSLSA